MIDGGSAASRNMCFEVIVHTRKFLRIDHNFMIKIIALALKDMLLSFFILKGIVKVANDISEHPISTVTEIGKEVEILSRSVKRGLVWEQIFLPENAPKEWADCSVLWNAVEASEKSKDSRLARELIVALPKELSQETNEFLLQYFIEKECVAKGMCAHVCYHDTDGHNPHAHIMLTVRPLNKDGTWQHKTEKEYLCVRNGEERGFTAAEYLQAQKDGWLTEASISRHLSQSSCVTMAS